MEKTDYFVDLADLILEELSTYYNSEVQKLVDTGYSKESLKNLIKMLEDPAFKQRPAKDVQNILTEIGFKISRQLSSVPVNISNFTKAIAKEYGEDTVGLADEYKIYFNKKVLFGLKEGFAVETLFTILHELYHVKQFNNMSNFLHDLPYEEDSLYAMIQSILTDIHPDSEDIKEAEKQLRALFAKKQAKEEKEADIEDGIEEEEDIKYTPEDKLYKACLSELDANLFAIKMIQKFIEKGYFSDPEKAKEALENAVADDILSYTNETINFSKMIYNKNLKVLSKIKEIGENEPYIVDGEVVYEADEVETLKLFYDCAKQLDMGKFAQKMRDKVEVVKTEMLLNEKYETYKYE